VAARLLGQPFCASTNSMARSIRASKKPHRRGRPKTTGPGVQVVVRLHQPILGSIDKWRGAREDKPTRPGAIRRLVELALAGSDPTEQRNAKSAAKAADMAGEQIDKMANLVLPEEERRARKRRLIKGPREFRDMRGDQLKPRR
jgi:hypothetical protein